MSLKDSINFHSDERLPLSLKSRICSNLCVCVCVCVCVNAICQDLEIANVFQNAKQLYDSLSVSSSVSSNHLHVEQLGRKYIILTDLVLEEK